ncbi:MAG TPA: Stp1/IreP family PP2C-type Ser/Thr phosphatase [Solirubrobacteraceae bacterium]|jgi:serine/threonine protein phosphatase PrpC|nr:Stp1/IreP family PP2C-type Ser/Thr phosphatase [Solirubrobacteraceae bacterium]
MLRVAEQYAGTDTGLQRRANEDALLARAPLFVVADGMGGARAGEVASKLAVESFHDGVPFGASPEQALAASALAANARIHSLSRENAEQAGMGTTLTAVYVGEREVAIAHVGDSRAYCLRDGELMRLTDDHSLVDELIREGRLTPAEAEEHPQRSIITRALGPEETVEVDTRSFRARGGDIYLLCSDGLTSMVPEVRLAEILREHAGAPLRDTGERLIDEANRAGGRDNVTVILLRLEEMGVDAPGAVPADDGAAADDHATLTLVPAPPPGALRSPATQHALAPSPLPAASVSTTGRLLTMQAPSVAVRRPRLSTDVPAPARRRRWRAMVPALVVLALLGMLAGGAYVASQSVYFIGTDARGLVTIYQGFPYKLPGGIELYKRYYVSGVGASTLSAARRAALLDHKLRSEHDAGSLMHSIELEELSE